MNALALAVSLLLAAVPLLSATPKIDWIQNSASNITIGPGAQIAQGSIFVIKGSGLGPATLSISATPFQNSTLSGTSVTVTVGTTSVNALMYYTSDGQIAALLPSNTPTGSGNFTVTYNNQTSPAFSKPVVGSNPGLYTIDSTGQGVGIVTNADYSLVSPIKAANCGGPNTTCGAANPGDTLILSATGLGPVAGTDSTGAGLGVNMPSLALTVWVGGVQAPVLYQGRSGCCIGEDQIVFTVPATTPLGCAVPLAVQIGNTVSNYVAMPVAAIGSRTCTAVSPVFSTATAQQVTAGGAFTVADIALNKTLNGNGVPEDIVKLQFFKISGLVPGTQPFLSSYLDDPPVGTCTVYSNTNEGNDIPFANASVLNAGASFTVKGPNSTVTATPATNQNPDGTVVSSTAGFLVPGAYTITGTGGADLGAFTANYTIPALPTLVSPANGNFTLNRANGLTVTWTGGGGTVSIQIASATDKTFDNGASVNCTAPASAGKLTIPAAVLLALPTTTFNFFQFITLPPVTPFTLKGADFALTEGQITGPVYGGFTIQ